MAKPATIVFEIATFQLVHLVRGRRRIIAVRRCRPIEAEVQVIEKIVPQNCPSCPHGHHWRMG